MRRDCLRAGLVLLALAAACCSNGSPIVPDMTAARIVARHAEAALDARYDPVADRAALERFRDGADRASTRADLTRAWQDTGLEPADLLARHVFRKAESDDDWPGGDVPEEAYVQGVRDGVRTVLEGGE